MADGPSVPDYGEGLASRDAGSDWALHANEFWKTLERCAKGPTGGSFELPMEQVMSLEVTSEMNPLSGLVARTILKGYRV